MKKEGSLINTTKIPHSVLRCKEAYQAKKSKLMFHKLESKGKVRAQST